MISLYNKKGQYSTLRDWTDILLQINIYLTAYILLLQLVTYLTRMIQ